MSCMDALLKNRIQNFQEAILLWLRAMKWIELFLSKVFMENRWSNQNRKQESVGTLLFSERVFVVNF